ncbi:MAG TPA: nodulation protein NfeD, partial [candidate division WOR-3 bacterium]|nr:nodulation protein NfeD [candidate division WOR-3 bacterium]
MKIFLFLILLSSRVYHVKAQGIINPPMAEYLVRAIDEAEDTRADLIVISLDTPGGLDESMRQIVKRELNSTVPVCVYVSPHGARAASAGVFITLAAHIAAMAPGTN